MVVNNKFTIASKALLDMELQKVQEPYPDEYYWDVADEETKVEDALWARYNAIEAENYHLKRQLTRKNKEIKQLKHFIRVWKGKYEKLTENKRPSYKNKKRNGGNRV